jgi:hypothetical protein
MSLVNDTNMLRCSDECPDFDLCRSCFDKKEHNQTHEMVVYSTPKQVIHPETCSSCNTEPIVGVLYICTEWVTLLCSDYF